MLRRFALFGAANVLLAACTSPVSGGLSNKDKAYQKKVTRVLVATSFHSLLLTEKQNNVFIQPSELQQSLTAKWSPLGVTWQVVDFDAVTDKKKALVDAVESFAPTQVLELHTASFQLIGGVIRVVDGYTVDVSLTDLAEKKRVWRSTIEFRSFAASGRLRNGPAGSAIPHQEDANELVDALTAKLRGDGLL